MSCPSEMERIWGHLWAEICEHFLSFQSIHKDVYLCLARAYPAVSERKASGAILAVLMSAARKNSLGDITFPTSLEFPSKKGELAVSGVCSGIIYASLVYFRSHGWIVFLSTILENVYILYIYILLTSVNANHLINHGTSGKIALQKHMEHLKRVNAL